MSGRLHIIDPTIKKSDALKLADNNAAQLARLLEVSRATVSDWGDELPPIHAYRLLAIFPHVPHHYKEVVLVTPPSDQSLSSPSCPDVLATST